MINKEDQAHVAKTRLNRMSAEATNMAAELHAEELHNASDGYITCVTLLDRGICREFCNYFQKLFTRELV